ASNPELARHELPPIFYAPSAAVLPLLAGRPRAEGELSLLTVSNPAYPQRKEGQAPAADSSDLDVALPPLPHTQKEADRIQEFFSPHQVLSLSREAATE